MSLPGQWKVYKDKTYKIIQVDPKELSNIYSSSIYSNETDLAGQHRGAPPQIIKEGLLLLRVEIPILIIKGSVPMHPAVD